MSSLSVIQDMLAKTFSDKDLMFTSIGNLGSTILGALLWFIIATLVDVSSYGRINYLIAVSVIPASIAILGLNTTVTTYVAKGDIEIAYESNSLILVTSLVTSIAMLLFYGFEIALITVSLIFFVMSTSYLLGSKKYREYSMVMVFQKVLQIFAILVLYKLVGIIGILIGYAMGPLIFSYRYFQTLNHIKFGIKSLREHLNFVIDSFGLNLIGTFSSYLDKIIIALVFGFSVLGIYQLAFQFLMVLMVLPNILYTYLLPQEASGSLKKEVKLMGIVASVFIALLVVLSSPLIISRFFPTYLNSIELIQVMGLAVVPVTFSSLVNAKLLGREESDLALKGGLIYILSLIIAIIILGYLIGAIGLALSVVIAHTIRSGYLVFRAGI